MSDEEPAYFAPLWSLDMQPPPFQVSSVSSLHIHCTLQALHKLSKKGRRTKTSDIPGICCAFICDSVGIYFEGSPIENAGALGCFLVLSVSSVL